MPWSPDSRSGDNLGDADKRGRALIHLSAKVRAGSSRRGNGLTVHELASPVSNKRMTHLRLVLKWEDGSLFEYSVRIRVFEDGYPLKFKGKKTTPWPPHSRSGELMDAATPQGFDFS
jgi:hypothetical protein